MFAVFFVDDDSPVSEEIFQMLFFRDNSFEELDCSNNCKKSDVMIRSHELSQEICTFLQQKGYDCVLKSAKKEEVQKGLDQLLKNLSLNNESLQTVKNISTDHPVFNHIIEYLNKNYSEKITLEDLSRHFNLSKNYICNLFSKYYHTTLTGFITELRMKAAAEKICDKSILIKEIAFACGYSSYVHFFKVFREYYGISPKQMREKGRI